MNPTEHTPNSTGCFFAFEGIDGSGKSTQIKLLTEKIEAHTKKKPLLTQEPSKSPIGLVLRQVLTKELQTDPRVVSSLFATDRLHHILSDTTDIPQGGILNAYTQGELILSDRYYFSSYAYHAVEQDLEKIIAENAQNASLLRPTATIFLDVPPELSMTRLQANRETLELYETLDRLTAVRDNYFKAFKRLEKEETVLIIKANKPIEPLAEEIFQAVLPFLEK